LRGAERRSNPKIIGSGDPGMLRFARNDAATR
jgi:hypothetical protein